MYHTAPNTLRRWAKKYFSSLDRKSVEKRIKRVLSKKKFSKKIFGQKNFGPPPQPYYGRLRLTSQIVFLYQFLILSSKNVVPARSDLNKESWTPCTTRPQIHYGDGQKNIFRV